MGRPRSLPSRTAGATGAALVRGALLAFGLLVGTLLGAEAQLLALGIGPGEQDSGASFAEARRNRLGWLEDAAIRERYLGQCGRGNEDAAVQLCGLPMTRPQRFGPFVSQRFQRIAFQRWLVEGP